jgi:hypothetical protein
MGYFKNDSGLHFKCPNCRTAFANFGVDSQDVVQVDRFKTFIMGLPLPKRLSEFLLSSDAAPLKCRASGVQLI